MEGQRQSSRLYRSGPAQRDEEEKIESMKRGFFDEVVCEYSAEID